MISQRYSLVVLTALVLLAIASGVLAQEAGGIGIPCNGFPDTCAVADFFELVQNVLRYLTFFLAVPVATVAIAYAGITMAIHPAQESKRTEAKEVLMAAVIGLVLVLSAWLIVTTIFNYLAESKLKQDVNSFLPTR